MRKRCYVNDFSNFNAGTMYSSDSRLTTVTRTLHISFYLSKSQVICHLGAILCGHLCCIGSVLL